MLDGVTNILDLGVENEVVLLPCSIGHHAFLQSFYYVCVLWKRLSSQWQKFNFSVKYIFNVTLDYGRIT